ncbi:integrator complex subunit 9 isoform X2 [Falco biarmicus]|nr:integrator complex subunit 9 isoform X3 [Falco rusticolus]XP_037247611.1 integrator complex subunit 9 isoform X3 [Falco rusticolus]XP_037247612.1 integrator complex subunit 9 isoform X3 [Falco rusticolus]XP_040454098.1 integrator complex subunit 9 isoform X3 [Falco naumanni]XP_040454099.1 integrator complex subunit 9 isoform X3 [Falco naumanni]XP_040454100.1 integrator complex subunit 9 isoform X3 [Falco naumanni]XP_055569934.1 integrator complex subunit 9 isoform X2 [Falco cherrug]XP_055
MLDCGLDMTSTLNFLPLPLVQSPRLSKLPGWVLKDGSTFLDKELKECSGHVFVDSVPEFCLPETELLDLSTVDVILISNYHCMMALPYITEYTRFTGTVYATEPTVQIGRLLMEELVNCIERVPKDQSAFMWKNKEVQRLLPAPLKDAVEVSMWRKCYTMPEVNAALSKIQMVGYSQKIELFGAVQVTPLSSGYALGSSNWIIQSHYEKVSYVSGSSLLTTHPQPMDQASLKNSDVLILTGLTQIPTANPDGMVGEFCSNLAMTVRNGGNVLVPCYPSGVIYDLLECLYQYIDSAGLSNVPFYFISPVANSSLEFSQIFAEWLCHNKQTKVYLPEPPFPHAELIQTNKLKHYPSIHGDFSNDFKQPCVVFTGHPSLRFGDVVHFMELWGKSSLNTVIFTEPDFSYLDALAPYQPLAMKCVYCPIDTRLNFIQVSKLLKEVQPLHVVCPEQYTQPPPTQSHRTDLMIDCQPPPMSYRRAEVLTLPYKRRYEKIEIMPELADSLVPLEIKPGISLATVTAVLHTKDNKHVLQLPPKPLQPPASKKRKRVSDDVPECKPLKPLLSGSIPVDQFVQMLEKHGFSDVKVEDTAKGHIVLLQEAETLIQIEEDSTHIICDNDEPLRVKLRDLVLKFLQKF